MTRWSPATLAAFALCVALAVWRFAPPAPRADAPPDTFAAGRAIAALADVLGPGAPPHPVGSRANDAVRARLTARLRRLGLEPTEQRGVECSGWGVCAEVVNVVATIAGEQPEAILLAVHYDSVPAGPGAGDDGAGVGVLLEVARALKRGPKPKRSIVLLFDDGEEAGLLGAKVFVRSHPAWRNVTEVINVEARGTSGPSFMFETGESPGGLIDAIAREVPRPFTSSLHAAVYERLPNDTDFTIFKRGGINGANFAFLDDVEHYHTAIDDLDHLSHASVQHHGDNVLALTRALAAQPKASPRRPMVWFDVLGLSVIRWPAGWSPVLGGAALLALVAAFAAAWRRERPHWPALAVGVGGLLAPVAGGMVAALLFQGWIVLGGRAEPWHVDRTLPVVALWCCASVGVVALARTLGRRVALDMRFAVVWAPWALFGLALGVALPGVSFLFLAPAAVAAVCALVHLKRAPSPATVIAPAVAAAIVWFPLVLGLAPALTLRIYPAVAVAAGLAFVPWLPALAEARGLPAKRAVAAPLLLALVAVGLAATQPAYSAHHPQRLSITHLEAPGMPSRWYVDETFGEAPRGLKNAAHLDAFGPSPLPWMGLQRTSWGPAPTSGVPAPTLEVVKRTPTLHGERLRVRLRSGRGSSTLGLVVPPVSMVRRAEREGHVLRQYKPQAGPFRAHRVSTFSGVRDDGVELDLFLGSRGATSVRVIDIAPLPAALGGAVTKARGPLGTPSQSGDLSIVLGAAELGTKR